MARNDQSKATAWLVFFWLRRFDGWMALSTWSFAVACAISTVLLGCQPDGAARAPSPAEAGTRNERPGFCSRDGADAVRDVFCDEASDPVHRLLDLERRLSVSLVPTDAGRQNYVGRYDSSGFMPAVLLAHSTALNGQLVSPINPRAILVGGLTTLAFTRGVQQVEIITLNRNERALAFYLLDFEQACNRSPTGCVPGDLYTPRIESDWERVTVRDAEELKNTPRSRIDESSRSTDRQENLSPHPDPG